MVKYQSRRFYSDKENNVGTVMAHSRIKIKTIKPSIFIKNKSKNNENKYNKRENH